MEATIQVLGSLADPELSGDLKVENGTVALNGFKNTFNDVSVDLVFDGDRVLFNEMSAASSSELISGAVSFSHERR